MKRCFKCGQDKPIEEFYRHKMMADGHLSKCKGCTRADVNANYKAQGDQTMKRLTPEDHVQNYFMTATPEACAIMLDKVQLIMRVRAIPGLAQPHYGLSPKLGRPRKKREAPSIAATEKV